MVRAISHRHISSYSPNRLQHRNSRFHVVIRDDGMYDQHVQLKNSRERDCREWTLELRKDGEKDHFFAISRFERDFVFGRTEPSRGDFCKSWWRLLVSAPKMIAMSSLTMCVTKLEGRRNGRTLPALGDSFPRSLWPTRIVRPLSRPPTAYKLGMTRQGIIKPRTARSTMAIGA
jgi:hypothetical protein